MTGSRRMLLTMVLALAASAALAIPALAYQGGGGPGGFGGGEQQAGGEGQAQEQTQGHGQRQGEGRRCGPRAGASFHRGSERSGGSEQSGPPEQADSQYTETSPETPSVPGADQGQGEQGSEGDRSNCRPGPPFRGGRVLRLGATADDYADGVLEITVEKALGKARPGDDRMIDESALVLVGERTKIYDAAGNRVGMAALAGADSVNVVARLLMAHNWRTDQDGERQPTMRAKRITITTSS